MTATVIKEFDNDRLKSDTSELDSSIARQTEENDSIKIYLVLKTNFDQSNICCKVLVLRYNTKQDLSLRWSFN